MPHEFRCTEYIDQVKVDVSSDGCKTVTGHVVLTRGILHDCPAPGMDSSFCMESKKAPAGLPMIDESHEIGSAFNNKETSDGR